jgi:hypothetical protein
MIKGRIMVAPRNTVAGSWQAESCGDEVGGQSNEEGEWKIW